MGETGTIYSDKKRKSNAAEAAAAQKLGGRRTRQSGGKAWARGSSETEGTDGQTPQLVFEHKRIDPDTKAMRIERKWLDQIAAAAVRKMKDPAVVLLFEKQSQAPDEWVMVPMEVARRLLGLSVESFKP